MVEIFFSLMSVTCPEKSYSILICLVHISLTITIFSVVLYRFIN